MDELISRQAAINKFKSWLEVRSYGWGELNMLRAVINELENTPTVQAEPLTDVEQRIFLSAMSREKEVCKAVDKEMSDKKAPYEYNLVSVCKEIERKVKAALWMN